MKYLRMPMHKKKIKQIKMLFSAENNNMRIKEIQAQNTYLRMLDA